MVHHKDEKSKSGDRKDAAHHQPNPAGAALLRGCGTREALWPSARPASSRRSRRCSCTPGEASSEVGEQVDPEAQSPEQASLIAQAVLQQLERFGLIALAKARGIETQQAGKDLLRHIPPAGSFWRGRSAKYRRAFRLRCGRPFCRRMSGGINDGDLSVPAVRRTHRRAPLPR